MKKQYTAPSLFVCHVSPDVICTSNFDSMKMEILEGDDTDDSRN